MVDQEPGANQNMKQFTIIEKIDTGILYALELTSSVSVLLLAFGLTASMANVLTEGSVLTDNISKSLDVVRCVTIMILCFW